MATSQDLLNQLSGMGQMPDFRQELVKAYDQPVLRPLVQESAQLEGQYLPALFDPFTQMGTSAADMSPEAKLSAIGGSLGRLQSRIGANQGIQNFYGAQIDNLANQYNQNWQNRYNSLRDLYSMQYQREQDAAARAAAARGLSSMFGGGMSGGMGYGAAGGAPEFTGTIETAPKNLAQRAAGAVGGAGSGVIRNILGNPNAGNINLNQTDDWGRDFTLRMGDLANSIFGSQPGDALYKRGYYTQ